MQWARAKKPAVPAARQSRLADTHRDPRHLARLVMIARNKKVYKPDCKVLLSKYFQKFSKAGKLEFEEGLRRR